MYHAVVTNKGLARLEGPADALNHALTVVRDAGLTGEDPDAILAAFAAATNQPFSEAEATWDLLARQGLIKVREPLDPGEIPVVVLSDPPIEHYRGTRGGRRPGAGAKPRRADGRMRVHRNISIDPDIHAAVERIATAHGTTYSETVEQLLRGAVATAQVDR